MFQLLLHILALSSLATLINCDSSSNLTNETLLNKWNSFKLHHKKIFITNNEEDRVYSKFRSNYLKVIAKNQAFEQHKSTYKTSLNEFSSLSYDEYIKKYLSKITSDTLDLLDSVSLPSPSLSLDKTSVIPENFDWRTFGFVTPAKQQSTCGSCWAFATTGAVETIFANKYGTLRRFSEQELVDCDKNNWGCDGGYPTNSLYYAYKNGLVEESIYPYKTTKGTCNTTVAQNRFKIRGYAKIPIGDEETIKRVVATYGPVTVALDASDWGFGHYSTGVFTSTTCKTNVQNHAVLVVGYGKEDNQDYWIVKNSWGRGWGLNGYIKMARNKNNMCGIATMASYGYL